MQLPRLRTLMAVTSVCATCALSLYAFGSGCGAGDSSTGADSGTSGDASPPVTIEIGPAGGTVTFEGIVITIPPGALSSTQTIGARRVSDQPPTGFFGGPVIGLSPEGLTFALPITVAYPLDPSPDRAMPFWSTTDGKGYERVQATYTTKTVTAKSTHFSTIFIGSWSGEVSTNSGFASDPFREESSPSVRGAFALTVPAGDGKGTNWDYDVHVSLFDLEPGDEPWILWPWVWATGPATAPLPERNSDPLTPYVVIVTTPHINDDRAPATAVFAKPATLTLLMGQHGHFGDTSPLGLLNGERTRPVMYEAPGGLTVPVADAGIGDAAAWWACAGPGSCGGALVDAAAPPASGKIVSTQLAWLAPVTLLVGVHPCPSFVGSGGGGLNCGPPPCATPTWVLTGGATGACHGDFFDYSLAAAGFAKFQASCVRHPEGGADSVDAGSASGTCTVAGPCGCFPPAFHCDLPDASAVCGIE